MSSIAKILARQNVSLHGPAGDPDVAHGRAELTRFIGENYRVFNALRRQMRSGGKFHLHSAAARGLIAALTSQDVIAPVAGASGFWRPTAGASAYIDGGWLEELGFLAMEAAGAEEVRFRQRVEWQALGVAGYNEIDVIARCGEQLALVSCKAAQPDLHSYADQSARMRDFLLEADYWNTHFVDGSGQAVLMISTDLIDETRPAPGFRMPSLHARAHVLEVDLVSLDFFRWSILVDTFRKILGKGI